MKDNSMQSKIHNDICVNIGFENKEFLNKIINYGFVRCKNVTKKNLKNITKIGRFCDIIDWLSICQKNQYKVITPWNYLWKETDGDTSMSWTER